LVVFTDVTAVTDARTEGKGSRVARTHDINEHTWVAEPQLFGRPRFGWGDNIKMDPEEMCWEKEWVQLAEDALQ
jgi:hypothetical protein